MFIVKPISSNNYVVPCMFCKGSNSLFILNFALIPHWYLLHLLFHQRPVSIMLCDGSLDQAAPLLQQFTQLQILLLNEDSSSKLSACSTCLCNLSLSQQKEWALSSFILTTHPVYLHDSSSNDTVACFHHSEMTGLYLTSPKNNHLLICLEKGDYFSFPASHYDACQRWRVTAKVILFTLTWPDRHTTRNDQPKGHIRLLFLLNCCYENLLFICCLAGQVELSHRLYTTRTPDVTHVYYNDLFSSCFD